MALSPDETILRLLKFRGPQRTETLARHLGISPTAARKHMAALSRAALVAYEDEAGSVGRPKRCWRLSPKAEARFPDSHAVLTVEMIDSVLEVFGGGGLDRLIADREQKTLARYRGETAKTSDLQTRIEALVRLRSEEGYMAEWQRLDDGSYLVAENHCPICAAARKCQGFCRSELAVFRAVLGPDATVERLEHIPGGARRCAYKVTPRAGAPA